MLHMYTVLLFSWHTLMYTGYYTDLPHPYTYRIPQYILTVYAPSKGPYTTYLMQCLYLWGHQMQNRCILFLRDNEALVYVINKQSCKDKNLMFFVRKLVLVCLQNNILFKAKHVRGVYNTLADSLSRLQVDTFKRSAPVHMEREPTDIPVHLQPQNWHL